MSRFNNLEIGPEFNTEGLPQITGITTSISIDSTDGEIPTAKAVYDSIESVNSLEELTDVDITGATSGQGLIFNNGVWVNQDVSLELGLDDVLSYYPKTNGNNIEITDGDAIQSEISGGPKILFSDTNINMLAIESYGTSSIEFSSGQISRIQNYDDAAGDIQQLVTDFNGSILVFPRDLTDTNKQTIVNKKVFNSKFAGRDDVNKNEYTSNIIESANDVRYNFQTYHPASGGFPGPIIPAVTMNAYLALSAIGNNPIISTWNTLDDLDGYGAWIEFSDTSFDIKSVDADYESYIQSSSNNIDMYIEDMATGNWSEIINDSKSIYMAIQDGSDFSIISMSDFGVGIIGSSGSNFTNLRTDYLTDDRTIQFPDDAGTIALQSAATGTFSSSDGKLITVTNGIITSIV